jgi:4-hydroxyphenylpyruvate dioxygenase
VEDDDHAPSGWYLMGVIVRPDRRRTGLAMQLTQARMTWLSAHTQRAYYFTTADNIASRKLHASFGFKEIRFFDISGKYTGLRSRALTSACGRIRIPINEDTGETGQIVEYLRRYNGEGIQHIAVGAHDLYAATDKIAENGVKFMPKPPAAYYDLSYDRVVGHDEPKDRMLKHGILIDGEGVDDGGETKILLQIFLHTVMAHLKIICMKTQ